MLNPHSAIEAISGLWKTYYQTSNEPVDLDQLSSQLSILNKLELSNLMTVVFSYRDLSIFHINQAAADFFGGPIDHIKKEGAAWILSCFEQEQVKFSMHAAEIAAIEIVKNKKAETSSYFTCYANWIINSKNGLRHRVLFRVFPIQFNTKGLPLLGMYLIHDIKPFLRDNGWWYRFAMDGKVFMSGQSEEKKVQRKDILTGSEKMILKELMLGLSSKEIAKNMNLSSHTIDNHRRHMLAKTGAVDTSALIHIAQLSGLVL